MGEREEKRRKYFNFGIKTLNFLCALLLLVDVFIRLSKIDNYTDMYYIILSIYLLLFAILLILSELKIKRVVVYVRFLALRWGIGIYIMLISVLLFNQNKKSEVIIAMVVMMVGIVNVVVGCYYHQEILEQEDARQTLNEWFEKMKRESDQEHYNQNEESEEIEENDSEKMIFNDK